MWPAAETGHRQTAGYMRRLVGSSQAHLYALLITVC
jgi:hypothetical protein